jgi:hypothetical protein
VQSVVARAQWTWASVLCNNSGRGETDFHEIWYRGIVPKFIHAYQFWLKIILNLLFSDAVSVKTTQRRVVG